jgi:hypothetical protein
MATTARQRRSLRSLYPPEHAERVTEAEARDPHYLDDTLDAIGPSLLVGGPPPTPEQIAAARAKALERGWLPHAQTNHRAERANGIDAAGTTNVQAPMKKVAKTK